MPEHRIRFRGGWESSSLDGEGEVVGRISLPMAWPPGLPGPIRLSRRFGRPPVDRESGTVRLELRAVPGLRAISLNGIDLGPLPAVVFDWSVPLAGLLGPRNHLILEVWPYPTSAIEMSEGWGSIGLVIDSE